MTPPPWDIGRPQTAFRALADGGLIQGRVLDVGCGTGEHVLMCAELGLEATGVDLSAVALGAASEKARERGLLARFIRHDALALAELGESFDTVLDCGLFHIFTDDERDRLVDSLSTALTPGGRYHMLCFSDRELGTWGPHRVTLAELDQTFARTWRIDSVTSSTIDITDPGGVDAWLVSATRL
jgi:cyclopropane fatty-acyl-phospholipid synthase-like methyltransferase